MQILHVLPGMARLAKRPITTLIRDDQPIINDIGLAALALLVSESAPQQKETMIRLIEHMLTGAR